MSTLIVAAGGGGDAITGAVLGQPVPDVHEIIPETVTRPPAGSSLPRLAAELPARLFLLDPAAGAQDMARQIAAVAAYLDADRLALVDVGGDVLAHGKDPGLLRLAARDVDPVTEVFGWHPSEAPAYWPPPPPRFGG